MLGILSANDGMRTGREAAVWQSWEGGMVEEDNAWREIGWRMGGKPKWVDEGRKDEWNMKGWMEGGNGGGRGGWITWTSS